MTSHQFGTRSQGAVDPTKLVYIDEKLKEDKRKATCQISYTAEQVAEALKNEKTQSVTMQDMAKVDGVATTSEVMTSHHQGTAQFASMNAGSFLPSSPRPNSLKRPAEDDEDEESPFLLSIAKQIAKMHKSFNAKLEESETRAEREKRDNNEALLKMEQRLEISMANTTRTEINKVTNDIAGIKEIGDSERKKLNKKIETLGKNLEDEKQRNKARDTELSEIRKITDNLKINDFANINKPRPTYASAASAVTKQTTTPPKRDNSKPPQSIQEDRSRNIVIHGITERKGENLREAVEKICYDAEIELKNEDIIRLQHLRHPLDKSRREVPVVLCLSTMEKKTEIMRKRKEIRNQGDKKFALADDEPKHMRVFKKKLRRIVKHCVMNSTDAQILENQIEINGNRFSFDNCAQIPPHY